MIDAAELRARAEAAALDRLAGVVARARATASIDLARWADDGGREP